METVSANDILESHGVDRERLKGAILTIRFGKSDGGEARYKAMALKARVLRRDKYECQYCGLVATDCDHVVPVHKGGEDSEANLVACCKHCNSSKGTKDSSEWMEDLQAYAAREDSRNPHPFLGEVYPCGHPRTVENSKFHGNGQVCRTCRQAIERKAQAKRRAKRSEKPQ